jgi:four helix bundle protein
MGALPHAESFEDLVAYQKARELAEEVFRLSQGFPKEEVFSLTSQIRRSSRAVGAQIAEAWAKRPYERHFVAKLTDADGEQQETQHWVQIARDCGYWTDEAASGIRHRCSEIGRLLSGMIAKSELFCGPPPNRLRDDVAEYVAVDLPPPESANSL